MKISFHLNWIEQTVESIDESKIMKLSNEAVDYIKFVKIMNFSRENKHCRNRSKMILIHRRHQRLMIE